MWIGHHLAAAMTLFSTISAVWVIFQADQEHKHIASVHQLDVQAQRESFRRGLHGVDSSSSPVVTPPSIDSSLNNPSNFQELDNFQQTTPSNNVHRRSIRGSMQGSRLNKRPPLRTLLVDDSTPSALRTPGKDGPSNANDIRRKRRIAGNVQFLLDFAVAGFGKCGTSTLMHWLANHEGVASFDEEVWDLAAGRPDRLVQRLYRDLPKDAGLVRGYKAPADVTLPHVLRYYQNYWPKTKLLIGIRHPVEWYQSLYNFRIQNALPTETSTFPVPQELIGACRKEKSHQTCTDRGDFAYYLLRLGKYWTIPSAAISPEALQLQEQILLRHQNSKNDTSVKALKTPTDVPYTPNPVFLFDLSQIKQDDFRHGVEAFLGLESENVPSVDHVKPGMKWDDNAVQQEKDRRKIDICQPQYDMLRAELMLLARNTADYLEKVFFLSPDVHVANLHQWKTQILPSYRRDPCSSQVA